MAQQKKVIKINVYVQTVGLLKLAENHHGKLLEIEDCLKELLESNGDGSGHISDCIWGEKYTADELLERLGIFVNKDKIFNSV